MLNMYKKNLQIDNYNVRKSYLCFSSEWFHPFTKINANWKQVIDNEAIFIENQGMSVVQEYIFR